MKAIVQEKYGSPYDVLNLKDIDKPVLMDDEVLVHHGGRVTQTEEQCSGNGCGGAS